jgi:hypothetical protein
MVVVSSGPGPSAAKSPEAATVEATRTPLVVREEPPNAGLETGEEGKDGQGRGASKAEGTADAINTTVGEGVGGISEREARADSP